MKKTLPILFLAFNLTFLVQCPGAWAQTLLLDDFEYANIPMVQPAEQENYRYLWHEGLGDDSSDSGLWNGTYGMSTSTAHDGTRSFMINTTQGNAYFMFYPYNGDWHNMREYQKANISNDVVGWPSTKQTVAVNGKSISLAARPDWKFNYFTRMRFWVKVPPGVVARPDGQANLQVGMYLRKSNGDPANAEDGGGHWYHHYNIPYTGEWHQIIVDTHPNHQRGGTGSFEWGNQEYVTGETGYNYFDALTWFYVDFQGVLSQFPGTHYFDGFELYREDNANVNIAQIYSMDAVYVPSSNKIHIGWSRDKGMPGDVTNHEVRYAFSDIYSLGWTNAIPAPNGTVPPNGYQGMIYETTQINVTGHSVIYIAIKPQNSGSFRQIAIPLSGGAPPPPAPPPSTAMVSISASPSSITSGQSTTLSWSSSNVTSCTASDGWSGARATSGNLSVSPTATTTYTLTCSGTNGSANKSTTVTVSAAPPSAPPPSSGLSAAAYSLNEGSGSVAADSSGNGNTLSISGASWSSGKTGNALSFNGTGWGDATNSSSLNITSNQLTLEAWVNPTTLSGDTHIVSKIVQAGQHNSPFFSYSLHVVNGNVPRFWVTTGGAGHTVQSSVGLTANAWYHVAGTYDGATMKIYVNGQLAGSASATGNINGYTGPLRLAANGSGGEVWSGRIDDVRVYSRALSQAEIQADMNTPIGGGGGVVNQPPAAPSALALQ